MTPFENLSLAKSAIFCIAGSTFSTDRYAKSFAISPTLLNWAKVVSANSDLSSLVAEAKAKVPAIGANIGE